MLVMGLWCFSWSEPRMHLCGWWWMMDWDHKAWNVLSLCGLIMDRLDLNYWRMFYCINAMIWVWLMSRIAAKLWVNICRSVHGLALVKAHMYVGLVHYSSVYIMKDNIWSCRWIWWLWQSSVICFVFWWLCYWQGFSDSEIDDASIDYFVHQWYLWVQYENLMKRGLQIMCCASGVSSLKMYETWYLEERIL